MLRILERLAARPWLTLALVALVTAAAAAACFDFERGELKVGIDPATERLLPAQDADRAVLDRARAVFGDTDPVLITVRFEGGVFTAQSLAAIERYSEALKREPGVADVFSLATAPNLLAGGEDVEVSSFTRQAADDPARIPQLAGQMAENPVYRNTLVSEDGREAAFALSLQRVDEAAFRAAGYPERLQALAQQTTGSTVVRVTGAPVIKRATTDALLRTFMVTVPMVMAVIVSVLLLAFRDLRITLAGTVTVAVALVWTLAVASLLGWKIHLLTALTPVLVVTQGLCYCIHWLADYVQHSDSRNAGARAHWALKHATLPLCLNALTTCSGFLALLLNDLPAIRQFAVLTAIGTALAALLALTLLPALAQLLGNGVVRQPREPFYHAVAAKLSQLAVRRRGLIIGVAVALLLGGMGLASRLQPSSEFVRGFPEDAPVRVDYEAINAQFGGANVLTVLIETHVADALTDPVRAQEVDRLAHWLRRQPEVGSVYSYVDLLKLLNRSLNEGDPAYAVIPDNAAAIKQILVFAGGDQIKRVLDRQFQTAAVVLRVRVDDAAALTAFAERVEARLAELRPPLSAHLTGSSLLATRTVAQLTSGQWATVALTAALIWAILAVIFTSPRAALLALLPNLVPVSIYFGLLQLTGIGLNPTTSLIASIVLGISVDDTIHYMVRFNREARSRGNEAEAVQHALAGVLRPITLTMMALCFGFLVFLGADMESQRQFGALAAFTLFLSWASDITLTPALASFARIVTLWDLLRLDLGKSPQHTIPLLSGLSLRQARTFALLSHIEKLPSGRRIITEGDYARDIYVIIDGQVEVWLERSGEHKTLASLSRGAVIGEAGYFGQRRTANIDATSNVRLLRFDSQDLERLRLRHPRIAATVFRNLNRIQSERIARMTAMLN